MRIFRLLVAGSALLLGCRADRTFAEPEGPLTRALHDAPAVARTWLPRFSVPVVHARCDSGDARRIRARCGTSAHPPVDGAWPALARRIASASASSLDADALHASALLDLLLGDSGARLRASTASLETMLRVAEPTAPVLADLSAAYLIRADVDDDARALLQALDASSQAVAIAPSYPPALYNRALALDALALDDRATEAWRAYLAVDATSPWADEARAALARLSPQSTTQAATSSQLGSPPPQQPLVAIGEALRTHLPKWSRAVLAHDDDAARAALAPVRTSASALARDAGDSLLLDLLAVIDSAQGNAARISRLARAQVVLGDALSAQRSTDYGGAQSRFVEAVRSSGDSPSFHAWARFELGLNHMLLGALADAEREVLSILPSVAARRSPTLVARIWWVAGIVQARDGRHAAAVASIERARAVFGRTHDPESAAFLQGVLGELDLLDGNEIGGVARIHRALVELAEYPTSVRRLNNLGILSQEASARGLWRAAEAIDDESAHALLNLPVISSAELHMSRARTAWARRDDAVARAALVRAREVLESLPPGDARTQLIAEVRTLRAATDPSLPPEVAYAMLDSSVKYFSGTRKVVKYVPALIARAGAAAKLGRLDAAAQDLRELKALYEQRRAELGRSDEVALVMSRARGVVDAIVTTMIAQGRAHEARDFMEELRSAARLTWSRSRSTRIAKNVTAIDYAYIGDTVFAWVVSDSTWEPVRTIVPREAMSATLDRVVAALERRADSTTWKPGLARMYDWLVRPVANRLPADAESRIVIVPDGVLARVPFAALWDSTARRYLVERAPVRVAATLEDAREELAPSGRIAPVALVAAPTADEHRFPSLRPLEFARAEVASIGRLYPGASIDTAATNSVAITRRLERAGIFHFAGHAVFDDSRPGTSALVIDSTTIHASAIEKMSLRGLQLVVLSACESVRGSGTPGAGFTGFSDAFLSAGAGGVVGSLWRVDDRDASTFMQAFHESYARSRDASGALRDAQLRFVRQPPTTWGAFSYVGR